MSGNNFVLDTNTVLYLLNGDETLAEFLFEKNLFISIITEMELLSYKKITAKEQKQIQLFLSELRIINISETIKETAIAVRKKYGFKLPDSIIAATAITLSHPLLTADKQLQLLPDLNIIFYQK